jgi:hypothetical protein
MFSDIWEISGERLFLDLKSLADDVLEGPWDAG